MRILLSFAATALLAFSAAAQSGLVARYLMNGNANDAVGSNNGAVIGATLAPDRFTQVNSAYNFDGAANRIEFTAPPPITASSWTISAWVKPGNLGQDGIAIYVGFDNGASNDGFGFGVSGGFLQGFTASAGGFFNSGKTIGNTQWAHIVMLRTNGVISFYFNGEKTPNDSTVSLIEPTDFTIGSQNGVRYFAGSIDDVRIYNRAISTNEIAQIFAGTDSPCYPHAATAIAVLYNGFVVDALITDGACGYTNNPPVTITGGGGSNATAVATVSNGMVTAVRILNAGCCYTNVPKINIGSPPFPTSVSIKISKFAITQHVMLGHTYVLEGTADLITWVTIGSPYIAESEEVVTEVDATLGYHFYRTREILGPP